MATYTPSQMAAAILAIPGGAVDGALQISVTAPAGAAVTAEKDGKTYGGVENTTTPGSYTVRVPDEGVYHVTATDGTSSGSAIISLSIPSVTIQYS